MLAIALHDDAFEASSMRHVRRIFRVGVPPEKKSVTLWWKKEMENIPILRQPTRQRTSEELPLTSATTSRALTRLGRKTGFEQPLQHYSVRRGTGNAVDSEFSMSCDSFLKSSLRLTIV